LRIGSAGWIDQVGREEPSGRGEVRASWTVEARGQRGNASRGALGVLLPQVHRSRLRAGRKEGLREERKKGRRGKREKIGVE
jgi:hypothetical protein